MKGIRVVISTYVTEDVRRSIDAAMRVTLVEDQHGRVSVDEGTSMIALAEQIAAIVWKVIGAFCPLSVEADLPDALPGRGIESVELRREDYERLTAGSENWDGDEAPVLLSEHWADLNDAAIEAARALAEISKRYPCTAFEVDAIGCEEYPYVAVGEPRRADPPVAGIRVYRGGLEEESIPEWSEIRAKVEQMRSNKGETR